jgi:hypothetical protein
MVEDGTTLMKLQKIELGDGVIMDKRGAPKWSYITKLELSFHFINLGRFASLFIFVYIDSCCVFLPLCQSLFKAMHYVLMMLYEGLVLKNDDNTKWSEL